MFACIVGVHGTVWDIVVPCARRGGKMNLKGEPDGEFTGEENAMPGEGSREGERGGAGPAFDFLLRLRVDGLRTMGGGEGGCEGAGT